MSEGVVKRGRGRPRKDSAPKNISAENNNQSNVSSEKVNPNNIINEDVKPNDLVNENVKEKNIYLYNKPNDEDNDDDLKQFLRQSKKEKMSKEINDDYNQNDIDEQTLLDIENLDKGSNKNNDIPDEDFNPLEESVKERGYTGGMSQNTQPNTNNTNNPNEEKIIQEPNYNIGGSSAQIEVDSKLMNPTNSAKSTNNDIPNDTTVKENNGGTSNSSSNNSNGESSTSSTKSEQKPVQENDNLKELSPKEKREAVEKTTDSILLAYKNYMPIPFVYFASHNLKKLQKLHDTDEIDLDTEVRRDGTTFLEYAKDFNNKVEEAFKISDEEVEALREPLFDVLMEQDIAFTPTQRLMFVGGQLIVAKVMMCVKFLREKKSDIDEMKEIHREKMEILRNQEEQRIINRRPRPEQKNDNITYTTAPSSNTSKPKPTPDDDVEDKKYVNNNKVDSDTDDEATTTAKKDISKEDVINYTEIKDTNINPSINKTPTLDDVLETETEEEEEEEEEYLDKDTKADNDIPE